MSEEEKSKMSEEKSHQQEIPEENNIKMSWELEESSERIKTHAEEIPKEKKQTPRWVARKSGQECCVVGCNNRSGKDREAGVKRHYYRIPKKPELGQLWIDAIPRTNWNPKYYHRVCSDHFEGGKEIIISDSVFICQLIFMNHEAGR